MNIQYYCDIYQIDSKYGKPFAFMGIYGLQSHRNIEILRFSANNGCEFEHSHLARGIIKQKEGPGHET